MGLLAQVGALHALLEAEDPAIVQLVADSWLTPSELVRGLSLYTGDLQESNFFDSIRRIASKHGKDPTSRDRGCPKGQRMVYGVCREVGKETDKPPKDFFAAARRIATQGPKSLERTVAKQKVKQPKRGEDDTHMSASWHRKKSEHFAQKSDFHKVRAQEKWAGDPRSAAHHVLRSIEYDVRRQHHDQMAEISPEERQRARAVNDPPRPQ